VLYTIAVYQGDTEALSDLGKAARDKRVSIAPKAKGITNLDKGKCDQALTRTATIGNPIPKTRVAIT
jgi:hypothetical protein